MHHLLAKPYTFVEKQNQLNELKTGGDFPPRNAVLPDASITSQTAELPTTPALAPIEPTVQAAAMSTTGQLVCALAQAIYSSLQYRTRVWPCRRLSRRNQLHLRVCCAYIALFVLNCISVQAQIQLCSLQPSQTPR